MTLRQRVFAQIVRVPLYGREVVLVKSSYNFLLWLKKLNSQFLLLNYGITEGRDWLKTSYGWRGLAKNVRIPSYRGMGFKIAQKTVI